jgi:hypothetical protein
MKKATATEAGRDLLKSPRDGAARRRAGRERPASGGEGDLPGQLYLFQRDGGAAPSPRREHNPE